MTRLREIGGARVAPGPTAISPGAASYYRARYYDQTTGRFLNEDPLPYDVTSFYSYVQNNPVSWVDPLGLWKCAQGANCADMLPALKAALDCLEKCAKRNDPNFGDLTVTCAADSHPPKVGPDGKATGDPHFWGAAVDIGHNANPGLSTTLFGKCFKECFPHKKQPTRTWGSYAQPEYNSDDPEDGWHFHIQYFGGANGGEGFLPDPIHPHGH